MAIAAPSLFDAIIYLPIYILLYLLFFRLLSILSFQALLPNSQRLKIYTILSNIFNNSLLEFISIY
jgi:hypothetical protein